MTGASRWTILGLPLVVLLALAGLSAAVVPLAAAQGAETPHPAHIHSGACNDLGDIVAPLADVQEDTAGERFGAQTAIAVEESMTKVPLQLGEILAGAHAVNIHQSAEEIQNYIACGDIGGRVVDNTVVIGLQQLNDSGYRGIAVLAGMDDGTEVTVYLAREAGGAPEAAATTAPAQAADATTAATEEPAAAATEAPPAVATEAPPAAATEEATQAAPASAEIAVDIRDFAFNPATIQISVGDAVTWTNQDSVPHTATASDPSVLQSGTIAPGASFSQVFSAPGEIQYHCEFHPNMLGTIVVQ